MPKNSGQKVLMVAYFFPPVGGIGAAGSQRILKFAKYLPQFGWEPIILTARETCYEPYLEMDTTLLERLPSEIKIIRTTVFRWLTKLLELKNSNRGNLPEASRKIDNSTHNGIGTSRWYQRVKDGLTDLFDIPDSEIGWLIPAVVAGTKAIRTETIDVIYSTGKPWTAHLIGLTLKRLTGKPLITDFRDPWLTNPFRGHTSIIKDRAETFLERMVIESSDLVISNTASMKAEFAERFSGCPTTKFVVLHNGFDPSDYDGGTTTQLRRADKFVLTHTGFLYGKRDPRLFLDALASLVDARCIERKKIQVWLVGSVELTYDLTESLKCWRLDDIVRVVPHVPYQESLKYLRNSDALLLLQPGTTTQIPSKLFEYLGTQKPILAISPRDGATASLVSVEAMGVTAEATDVQEIATAILKLYRGWEKNPATYGHNGATFAKYHVKNITANLAEQLGGLSNHNVND
jgi:glycosyltransferase involved in cell wall biosynthesis